jgi:DNA repair photolyase
MYRSRPVTYFQPDQIVLTKGSLDSARRRHLVDRVCAVYPEAEVVREWEIPHNRVRVDSGDLLSRQQRGKRTLVFGEHQSAVRLSAEVGNCCPNYHHFSPYGFCPYNCASCYLAGTTGVRFSPTVKIFVNLPEILDEVDRQATALGKPTAFYLGKLQDALALDPLTGYSRKIIPFFAEHRYARLTLLTKSAEVGNLLDLDHRGRSVLSWSVNPAEIIEAFETNTPSLESRLATMEACQRAGYPVRAVVMPVIPVAGWEENLADSYRFGLSLVKPFFLRLDSFEQVHLYRARLRLSRCP